MSNSEPTVLPLFDLYEKPYKKDGANIQNYKDAVVHMAEKVVDNALENYTDERMESSAAVKVWHEKMPEKTPECINFLQHTNEQDKEEVLKVIKEINCTLSENQKVLHGGKLPDTSFTTKKTLSTTTDTQVAFREAEYGGKAYKNNELNIYEITIKNPKTNVFVTDPEGEHGNEKEIIFAPGAKIEIGKKEEIKDDYVVYLDDKQNKKVKVNLIQATIS